MSAPASTGNMGLIAGLRESHMSQGNWALEPQLLKPSCILDPVLLSKRSHLSEKPSDHNRRKPTRSNNDPAQPKISINKEIKSFTHKKRMSFFKISSKNLHKRFLIVKDQKCSLKSQDENKDLTS